MTAMKWIKLSTALFDDDKLLLLEQLEEGCMLQLLWVKLLCLAGKQGRGGVFLLKDDVPYTPAMLGSILRLDKALVERGLETFREFGMVHLENGAYAITNWNRHQSMSAYDKKRAYDRDYQRKKRNLPDTPGYGIYKNVTLTDAQFQALRVEFPQDYSQRLDRLSEYMQLSGKVYSDPLAVIRKWAREDDRKLSSPGRVRSFLELAQEVT